MNFNFFASIKTIEEKDEYIYQNLFYNVINKLYNAE
jgi:hypothetical protein